MRTGSLIPLLLFFTFFPECSESYRNVFEHKREIGESLRLFRFTRQSVTGDGKIEWELRAEEAYLYNQNETRSKIIAYDFAFDQYEVDSGKKSGVITAKRGEIDYQKKRLQLDGDVVFQETSGRRVSSESMSYDMETEVVTSDVLVTIVEGGRTTNCTRGVIIDRQSEKEICKGPNILQIHRPKGPGDEEDFDDIFH